MIFVLSCLYILPLSSDKVGILWQMYKDDGVSKEDITKLINRFQSQPLDFFGAIRAGMYDGQIRDWIKTEITGERRELPSWMMNKGVEGSSRLIMVVQAMTLASTMTA